MLYVVAEEINNRLGCWISYSSRTNSRLMLIGGARAPPRNWIYLARLAHIVTYLYCTLSSLEVEIRQYLHTSWYVTTFPTCLRGRFTYSDENWSKILIFNLWPVDLC